MKRGQQDILSSTPNGKNVFFRPPRDSTLHTIKRKKEKIKKGIRAQNMAMMMMPPTVIAIYHTDAGALLGALHLLFHLQFAQGNCGKHCYRHFEDRQD